MVWLQMCHKMGNIQHMQKLTRHHAFSKLDKMLMLAKMLVELSQMMRIAVGQIFRQTVTRQPPQLVTTRHQILLATTKESVERNGRSTIILCLMFTAAVEKNWSVFYRNFFELSFATAWLSYRQCVHSSIHLLHAGIDSKLMAVRSCSFRHQIVQFLIDFHSHFGYFSLKISVAYFSSLLIMSRKSNEGWHCQWPWAIFVGHAATINGFIVHCSI